MLFGSIEEEVLARSVGAADWVNWLCSTLLERIMTLSDLQVKAAEWLLDVLYPLSEYLLLKVAALAWFLRGPLNRTFASQLRCDWHSCTCIQSSRDGAHSVGQEQSLTTAALLLQTSVLSFSTIAPLNVPVLLLLGSEAITACVLVLSVTLLLSVRAQGTKHPYTAIPTRPISSPPLKVLQRRPGTTQPVTVPAQAQRAALLLLLLRGALDSAMPLFETGSSEEDDVLVGLLGGSGEAKRGKRTLPPFEPLPRVTPGDWVGATTAALGRHRGLLHAMLCVVFCMGWVSRKAAMVLLYLALPLYGMVWNGLPLVPSSGGWVRVAGVLGGCVGVGALLHNAIRGLMW